MTLSLDKTDWDLAQTIVDSDPSDMATFFGHRRARLSGEGALQLAIIETALFDILKDPNPKIQFDALNWAFDTYNAYEFGDLGLAAETIGLSGETVLTLFKEAFRAKTTGEKSSRIIFFEKLKEEEDAQTSV